MPNIFSGKVIKVLSGPTPRSIKSITIVKVWEDGIFTGEAVGDVYERQWFEVIAVVDEEFIGKKRKSFDCDSLEEAVKIQPGFTYNY